MASKSRQLISSIHSMAEAKTLLLVLMLRPIIVMMKRLRVFTSCLDWPGAGLDSSLDQMLPEKVVGEPQTGSYRALACVLRQPEHFSSEKSFFSPPHPLIRLWCAHTRSCAKSLKPSVALASLVCFYFYLHFSRAVPLIRSLSLAHSLVP
jgi:hypothetical protein